MPSPSKIQFRRGPRESETGHTSSGRLVCLYKTLRNPLPIVCCICSILAVSSYYFLLAKDDYNLALSTAHNNEKNNIAVAQDDVTPTTLSLDPLPVETDSPSHKNGLSINQSTLEHLKNLPPFPKIVHLIWNDKDILNTNFQMLEHGAKNLQRLNPTWEFRIHNFEDVENGIQQFQQHPDIPESMKKDLSNAHIVEKTDAYRLIRVYETGGLYVDIDRVMNKNLDDIINPSTTKLVIPSYYDYNFAQDLFGSSPKNELILNVFKRQCKKREKFRRHHGWINSNNHMDLVKTFSESLEMDIFGQMLNQGNRTSNWEEARHLLNFHTADMVVTQSDEWCDGLLVTDYEGCKSVHREDLYKAYNVTPWAAHVDEVWNKAEKAQQGV